MILYHGTTFEQAEDILLAQEIRTTSKGNTRYPTGGHSQTTFGYVYLSTSINQAFGFGVLASQTNHGSNSIAVFEIELGEDEIEVDLDEKEHNAIVTSVELPANSCFRISRNLAIQSDIKRYFFLHCRDRDHAWRVADNPKLVERVHDRWIAF